MPHKITVLLADDHALVRRGFRRMLEDDPAISVVAEASDGEEAVRIATDLRPRVIVMDCAMPELDRKSTRLNSSHGYISYAVFCLKKKKQNKRAKTIRVQCVKTIARLHHI